MSPTFQLASEAPLYIRSYTVYVENSLITNYKILPGLGCCRQLGVMLHSRPRSALAWMMEVDCLFSYYSK